MSPDTRRSTTGIVMTVLMPFGAGFYLSYLYRTMNAVIEPQLRLEFDLGASGIGFLTGVYFISFAAVQIPLGIMTDRYGPRRVQVVLLTLAAIGGVLFGVGESFLSLSIGRLLIGIGVAGGIVAVLSANAIWFPPEKQALMNSIGVCFGGLGALSATLPMEFALDYLSWRQLFLCVSAVTMGLVAVIYFLVPDRSGSVSDADTAGLSSQWREVMAIYRDPFFWRIGFLIVAGFATYISYQSLWAGPWLRDVAGMERLARAEHLLYLQAGMFTGILSGGFLADRIAPRGRALERFIAAGVVIFFAVQVLLVLEVTALAAILWFGFGFFGSVLFLTYSVYAQHYPPQKNGRVNTANNLVMFSLAFATQWGIGEFISLWPELDGQKYPADAHQWAMALVLLFEILALLWFIKPEKGSRDEGSP